MFDIGWTELLLIGIVALIVIGPKDLPQMFFQLGRVMARLKSMAREFQGAMNEAARQSGLDEAARDVANLSSLSSPTSALKQAADKLERWDPLADVGKPKIAVPADLPDPEELDAAELAPEPVLPKAPKPRKPKSAAPKTVAKTAADPKPETSTDKPA